MNLLFPIASGFAAATVTILFMEVCNKVLTITLSVRHTIELQIRYRTSIANGKLVVWIALAVQYSFSILVSCCYFYLIIKEFISLNVWPSLVFGVVTGTIGIFCYALAISGPAFTNTMNKMSCVIMTAHIIQALILCFIYNHFFK